MLTVTAAAVIALAAPTPVTPLSVAVANTCDYLIISVSNPWTDSVKITPKYGSNVEPSLVVEPGDTVPINLPARDGLTAALTINDGATLGPWVWKAPQVCPQMGGSVDDDPSEAAQDPETPETFHLRTSDGDPSSHVYHWLFFAGLIATGIGVLGMLPWMWSRRALARLTVRRAAAGRHRRADQPPRVEEVVAALRRHVVRRLSVSRR